MQPDGAKDSSGKACAEWLHAQDRPLDSMPGFQPIDQAGADLGQLQEIRLQSGAESVARQLRKVGRQAQTVQIVP